MLALSIALSIFAACGDDASGDVDAGITLFDAPPEVADAAPAPDAPQCSPNNCDNTCCDNVCIDTSSDDQNCNGCNMACTVGTHCETDGELIACGECPGSFIPDSFSDPDGTVLDLRPLTEFPAFAGFSQFTDPNDGDITDGFGVIYPNDGSAEVGVEYNLTVGFLLPQVIAVYDGSLLAQTYDTAYGATAGTLVFSEASATCVAGTITGATFSALDSALPPSVADDGCSFLADTLVFAIGDCDVVVVTDAGIDPPPPN